jgi:hypothetical protein
METLSHRTPWEYIDSYPPPYCRILAKKKGSGSGDMAITDAELAIKTGIPLSRVQQISKMETWAGVTNAEMRSIFEAINFDPTNSQDRSRVNRYQLVCQKRHSTPFRYLRMSPKWETEFLPLFLLSNRIMKSRIASTQQEPTPALATAI